MENWIFKKNTENKIALFKNIYVFTPGYESYRGLR